MQLDLGRARERIVGKDFGKIDRAVVERSRKAPLAGEAGEPVGARWR